MAKSNPNLTAIFTDTANAIRSKTNKTGGITPVDFADEISSISGSVEPNIHFSSTTAPSDTSKLWVKTDSQPQKVIVSKTLELGSEILSTLSIKFPATREWACCGTVGTKMYIFGGYSDNIYRFDTNTKTLTTLATTLPESNRQIACGVVGTKIYLFGGSSTANIYEFDTDTETISKISQFPNLSNLYSVACGVVGTKIYLFGGSTYPKRIWEFNTDSGVLSILSTTLPRDMSAISCGVVGTKIYLFGGSSSSKTIYRFDVSTQTLTALSATFSTTYDSRCGVVGTKIYLFGGSISGSNQNTIYRFDADTETISMLSQTLPVATRAMSCGVVGTKIYLLDTYSSKNIYVFTVLSPLENGTLLVYNTGNNSFKVIDNETFEIEAQPSKVFLGNSNNEAELVTSALYLENSWQELS